MILLKSNSICHMVKKISVALSPPCTLPQDYIRLYFFDADLINIQGKGHMSTFGSHSVLRTSTASVARSELLDRRVANISTGFTLSVIRIKLFSIFSKLEEYIAYVFRMIFFFFYAYTTWSP